MIPFCYHLINSISLYWSQFNDDLEWQKTVVKIVEYLLTTV